MGTKTHFRFGRLWGSETAGPGQPLGGCWEQPSEQVLVAGAHASFPGRGQAGPRSNRFRRVFSLYLSNSTCSHSAPETPGTSAEIYLERFTYWGTCCAALTSKMEEEPSVRRRGAGETDLRSN